MFANHVTQKCGYTYMLLSNSERMIHFPSKQVNSEKVA